MAARRNLVRRRSSAACAAMAYQALPGPVLDYIERHGLYLGTPEAPATVRDHGESTTVRPLYKNWAAAVLAEVFRAEGTSHDRTDERIEWLCSWAALEGCYVRNNPLGTDGKRPFGLS